MWCLCNFKWSCCYNVRKMHFAKTVSVTPIVQIHIWETLNQCNNKTPYSVKCLVFDSKTWTIKWLNKLESRNKTFVDSVSIKTHLQEHSRFTLLWGKTTNHSKGSSMLYIRDADRFAWSFLSISCVNLSVCFVYPGVSNRAEHAESYLLGGHYCTQLNRTSRTKE